MSSPRRVTRAGSPASLLLPWALVALVMASAPAAAQVGLPVSAVGDHPPRVDGMLRDWRGVRFSEVGRGRDGSMRYALAWGEGVLYVAAEVRDQRLIRDPSPTAPQDAVILAFAGRRGRGPLRGVEVYLEAGVSGRSAARALIAPVGGRPHGLRGAQIVEAPSDDGYTLEASVPIRALGLGALEGLRGAIRLRDVDSAAHPTVRAEPASAPLVRGDLGRLPELLVRGGEGDVLRAFLRDRGIEAARPRFSLRGELFGGGPPERLAVVGRYVVVYGRGYQDGRGYGFLELPVASSDDVSLARLVELTGDAQRELLLRYRERGGGGYRDMLSVFRVSAEGLDRVFAAELEKGTGSGRITGSFRLVRRRRGPSRLTITTGEATNLDATSFRERPAADAEPLLRPWGPIRSRTFAWDGHRLSRVEEEPNPDYVEPGAQPTGTEPARAREQTEPEAPALPSEADLVAAVRRDRHIPRRVRPRLRRRGNLVGDRQPETAFVLGTALVALGPGYRGGRGYFFYGLPLERAEDLLDLRTHDLDGDGHEEIVLRVRQRTQAGHREVLLVHRLTERGFPRLLAVEVAREEGGRRVDTEVRFLRRGLELRARRARGFDQSSWPYAQEASNGIDPPVLPWLEGHRRYQTSGGRLVAR